MQRWLFLFSLLFLGAPWSFAEAPAQESTKKATDAQRQFLDLPYVSQGHERQKLDLFLPPEGRNWPLLVWVHGGAWMGGSKERGPAKPFVSKGYAVASINYRLSSHAIFPAQLLDCKAAIRWLRAHASKYGYDGSKIAVWGSSAGGHLVSLLGTTGDVEEFDTFGEHQDISSRVQCVVDFFGPSDLTAMARQAPPDSRIDHDSPTSPESRLVGGPIQERQTLARTANPITYVTPDDPPFLILHGDKDNVVPIGQSELLRDALKAAGVSVTYHVVEGAGHGFGRRPEIQPMVEKFLAEHFTDEARTR